MDDEQKTEIYDLVIIGSGTAGLTAGLYAGRYRMKTLIIGEAFGGEGTTAGETRNYPGFMKIDGYDLMSNIKEQVDALGVPIESNRVTAIKHQGHCFDVFMGTKHAIANTIILAVGAKHRTLGLPREEELKGKGLHYCVTCDGPLYRGKVLALVGGGDASVKGINLISEYVSKVYLIVREKEIIAEPINLEQMKKLGDKVEILMETEVKELIGKDRVERIRLSKPYQGSDKLDVSAVFVEIGAVPAVKLAKELELKLDKAGYIEVDKMMKTSVDGVFAAGDAVNHFGHFKQYVTAAALGAVAATSAYEDHKIHGDLCNLHAIPHRVDSHA